MLRAAKIMVNRSDTVRRRETNIIRSASVQTRFFENRRAISPELVAGTQGGCMTSVAKCMCLGNVRLLCCTLRSSTACCRAALESYPMLFLDSLNFDRLLFLSLRCCATETAKKER